MIDIAKLVATILILGSHALPIFHESILNRYYGQWFFRWCVPFFFIATGFFLQRMDTVRILSYSKRLSTLYVISTLLYTPFIIKAALEENGVFDRLLSIYKSIVFGYNHLWYLSASLASVLLFIVIRLKAKGLLKWTPLLIIGGGIAR